MKELNMLFASKLRPLGFKGTGNNYYYIAEKFAIAIQIRKNMYNDWHYPDLGLWITDVQGMPNKPRVNSCYVAFSVGLTFDVDEDTKERFFRCLKINPENFIEKKDKLDEILEQLMVPEMTKLRDWEFIKKLYSSGEFEHGFLHIKARKYFEKLTGVIFPRKFPIEHTGNID